MGHLTSILLAVSTLLGAEVLPLEGRGHPLWLLALLPLPHLIGLLERRAGVAGRFRLALAARRLGDALPVLGQLVAVGLLGWLVTLEELVGEPVSLLEWPHPALLLGLLPFVLLALLRLDAAARGRGQAGRAMRAFQLRMLLTGLGPVALYVLLASLLRPFTDLRVGVELISLHGLAFSAGLLLLLLLALPRFLAAAWDTEPLTDPVQREVLEAVARRAGFRCRELRVWRTGGLMANAAIVGVLPAGRRVLFTDALLASLGPRQLAAVYAHEIGHAKRGHVWLFLAWTLVVFGGLEAALAELEVSQGLEVALLAGGVGLALWLLAFGWLSRRVELDADLYCQELLRDGIGIVSALQAVAGGRHHRSSWRHFSTARRIRFLDQAAADPAVGRRLRGLVRGAAWTAVVLLVPLVGWQVNSLVRAYPTERVVADLALGRYGAALEGAERLPDWAEPPTPGLERRLELVRKAGLEVLGDRTAAVAATSELARARLEAGEAGEALAWLELAGLAGDRPALAAAGWLSGRLEGELEGSSPPPSAGPWAEGLGRLRIPPGGAAEGS